MQSVVHILCRSPGRLPEAPTMMESGSMEMCIRDRRVSRLCRHIGIEIKIFVRIKLRSVILSGGILGEDGLISINIVEPPIQISFHIAQELSLIPI